MKIWSKYVNFVLNTVSQECIEESLLVKGVTVNANCYGWLKNMTKKEALEIIADGHTFWLVKTAKEVCKSFDLKLPKSLIETYHSQKEANPTNHFKGLFIRTNKWPVSGVNSHSLSCFVAEKILGNVPSGMFHGRGTGARANAEAVAKKLGVK